MHRVVFLESGSIRTRLRRLDFPHVFEEYAATATDEMRQRLEHATIAIVNKLPLTAELLGALPKLRLIAVAATGTDNIDLDACRDHGVVVSNVRDYAEHSVPEHVLMLMLALRRQLPAYRADVAAGKWQAAPMFCLFDHPIRDLHGSTLGVFGRGSLGQAVARLAEAFGMRVLWGERKGAAAVRPGYVDFEALLATADVVSLHCPLNADTRGMIGEAEFGRMKPTALLINAARGGLVDEAALAAALAAGRIGGAGVDVLSREPPHAGNPLLDDGILGLPNFILTPHAAWASDEAMRSLAGQLAANIEAYVQGSPRNRVA